MSSCPWYIQVKHYMNLFEREPLETLTYRTHDTPQTRHPLWSTVRLSLLIYDTTPPKRDKYIRDRPFNLKGGSYGNLICSEFFFRTTRELEYLFFSRIQHYIIWQKLWINFFFLHQNQNNFFSNIGNQNIVLEKKI
jgi:hypothetical protein